MSESNVKRIGIFVYNSPIFHYIKDFVIKIADDGFMVDLFLKDCTIRHSFSNTNDFALNKNIRFYDLTSKETRLQTIQRKCMRLSNKIALALSCPRNYQLESIINGAILNKSNEILKTSQYYCLIGIEKEGLIWAGILAGIYHCPLVYFSLELYIEDNPAYYRFSHLRNAEKQFHKAAIATIVQDKARAEVLLKSNGIEKANICYFPVSSKCKSMGQKSKILKSKLGIDSEKKILLHFGAVDNNRFLPEIVRMARSLSDEVILVVHGFGQKADLNYLKSIADQDKVKFSLEFVAEDNIEGMISCADIGVALYKTTNANDRLVALSSSKVAYYTQCGVPFIAFDSESFRELRKAYQCVELIKTIDEIPLKVRKILDRHEFYREQSFEAYKGFYDLDKNFCVMVDNLRRIIDGTQLIKDIKK